MSHFIPDHSRIPDPPLADDGEPHIRYLTCSGAGGFCDYEDVVCVRLGDIPQTLRTLGWTRVQGGYLCPRCSGVERTRQE